MRGERSLYVGLAEEQKLSLLLRMSESLFFACAKKSNQKKAQPGRDPSGCARRSPAILAERGDGAQLASLRHVRLFAPRSTAVLGSLYGRGSQKPKSNSKITSSCTFTFNCKNNSKRKNQEQRQLPPAPRATEGEKPKRITRDRTPRIAPARPFIAEDHP